MEESLEESTEKIEGVKNLIKSKANKDVVKRAISRLTDKIDNVEKIDDGIAHDSAQPTANGNLEKLKKDLKAVDPANPQAVKAALAAAESTVVNERVKHDTENPDEAAVIALAPLRDEMAKVPKILQADPQHA